MPNWCMNTVRVFGGDEDIEKFKEFVKSDEERFSFQTIKPVPKELEHTRSPRLGENDKVLIDKYGADNWYDWCIENWGVKWDTSEVDLEEYEDELTYNFDTAWGPPKEIYDILVDKFPNLTISWFYNEPNMQLAGYLPSSY